MNNLPHIPVELLTPEAQSYAKHYLLITKNHAFLVIIKILFCFKFFIDLFLKPKKTSLMLQILILSFMLKLITMFKAFVLFVKKPRDFMTSFLYGVVSILLIINIIVFSFDINFTFGKFETQKKSLNKPALYDTVCNAKINNCNKSNLKKIEV
jgi:sorbitol-specific phosphotransferase system component IIC